MTSAVAAERDREAPEVAGSGDLWRAAPPADADLDAAEAFYARRSIGFTVAAAPALATRLAARGYAHDRAWTKFVRGVEPVAHARTDLRVEDVGPALAPAFGAVVAAGFGLPEAFGGWFAAVPGRPGWTCLAALDGREPVAAAALFAAGRQGWAALGATLPGHRGRGGQGALLAGQRDRRPRRRRGAGPLPPQPAAIRLSRGRPEGEPGRPPG